MRKKLWYFSFSFQVYENWKMTLIILFSVINLNRMSDSVKIRIFVNRRQVTNFFKVMTFKGNYCCEINESLRAITSWVFMKISGDGSINKSPWYLPQVRGRLRLNSQETKSLDFLKNEKGLPRRTLIFKKTLGTCWIWCRKKWMLPL